LGILIAVEWALWDGSPWWMLIGIGIVTLWVWDWSWQYVAKAYEVVGVPIVKSLAESESYGSLIGGYLVVIFGGAVLLTICLLILLGVSYLTENWWFAIRVGIGLAGNFVFGMIMCWIGIIIDGIITMTGALVVFVLRTIVDTARWVMWRISSYPKGPLTATLTLIGAVLAVIKMFGSK
jgi:hypothetical protein